MTFTSSVRRRVWLLVWIACWLITGVGFGPLSTAAKRVREGIQQYQSGNFDEAAQRFAAADVVDPENDTILFDRACALAATGDTEEARQLWMQSSMARDVSLAAKSHYNLGCLAAETARVVLGEDPVAANPEQREPAVASLMAAVGHYRDCLRLDREHRDARHNLELIRLFLKHLQAKWEERDREAARKELNLLEFLALIEQRQTTLRSGLRELRQMPASPRRREQQQGLAEEQLALQEEVQPLKDKLKAELQPAAPSTGPSPSAEDASQRNEVLALLEQLAEEAGRLMLNSSDMIKRDELDQGHENQLEVHDRLNQIYMGVAPFASVVQRATTTQRELVQLSDAFVKEADTDASGVNESDGAEATDQSHADDLRDVAFKEAFWRQGRVTNWSQMLGLKAQAELEFVDQQAGSAVNDPTPHGDPAVDADALKAAFEKAIELAPQVSDLSVSASEHLSVRDAKSALPEQTEALGLLSEIEEALPKQPQQPEDSSSNEDSSQHDKNDSSQPNQPQPDASESESQRQESQEQQAMSVLRRARERERQHRDRQKQLRQAIGRGVPVGRDW